LPPAATIVHPPPRPASSVVPKLSVGP
jgi:hypothetical protein